MIPEKVMCGIILGGILLVCVITKILEYKIK